MRAVRVPCGTGSWGRGEGRRGSCHARVWVLPDKLASIVCAQRCLPAEASLGMRGGGEAEMDEEEAALMEKFFEYLDIAATEPLPLSVCVFSCI